MHVLSISALKGGVGKTTVTLGLASAAMSKGLRTLVIDLDPQCNVSNGLGAVGDFNYSAAEVIKKPRHSAVFKAIVASSWAKGQTGRLDIMVGHSRLTARNTTNPTFKSLWNLEQALSRIEKDYDLVLIDTPPSINALTRMAWVASDRVLLVTEPSINAVLAIESGMKALAEVRKQVNRQVSLFGILINRIRPSVAEHQYRINEIEELYGQALITTSFEEKSAIQQAQGAGRSIHSWPGQSAAKIAAKFDQLLEEMSFSFASEDIDRIEETRKPNQKNRHSKRTHEPTDSSNSKSRLETDRDLLAKGPRIEMVTNLSVSPEYQDKFNEVLRQTMTEKQIRALTEPDEED
ncbi:MAG: ParA family protein [Micrococcales bacterium]|nr:ParA family protein [Actinomycetota bacterium]NCA07289.1 ParA family protein [Micrococcales bacterium]